MLILAGIETDQGPPFASSEFCTFLKHNGIRQSFSPVYHPSSNGAAENAVKLCKRAIKKALRDNVDLDAALQTYLMAYRNSEHSTTGESPAMLLQRRSLRSRLDLLRNDGVVEGRVSDAQARQARQARGTPAGERAVAPGEPVWARGYGHQDRWLKGTVLSREGSNRYVVDNGDGLHIRRHIDQIRRGSTFSNVTSPSKDGEEARGEDVVPEVGEGSGESDGGRSVADVASSPRVPEIEESAPSTSLPPALPPQQPSPKVLRPLPHRRHRTPLEID